MRLVARQMFKAPDRWAEIEYHGHMRMSEIGAKFAQHLGEAIDRVDRAAVRRREDGDGEEGAVNQREGINQQKGLAHNWLMLPCR